MNIAVIFDQKLVSGGGYQQSLNTLKILNKISKNKYNFIFFTTIFKNKLVFRREKIKLNYLKSSFILRILSQIRLNPKFQLLKIIIDLIFPLSLLEIELSYKKIDLVYFVSPSNLATDLRTINFIFTIWDLCHRDHVEFAEVKSYGCIGYEYVDIGLGKRNFAILSKLSPWDHIPGILFVREAGCSDIDFDCQPYNFTKKNNNLIVGNSKEINLQILNKLGA